MRFTKKHLGWKFFLILAVFVGIGAFGFEKVFKQDIFYYAKKSLGNRIVINFGLTGQDPLTVKLGIRALKKILTGEAPAKLKTLEVDVKFKHWDKIKKERDRAQNVTNVLVDPETYPAKIRYNGKTYPARIRLKGDYPDHRVGNNRWSLRVNLKGGKTIFGMNGFSLHKPPSRQTPDEMLFQAWMRASGNIALRHEFANIIVNGDAWGVMNVEEYPTRFMLELSGRKESPILRVGNDDSLTFINVNKEKKLTPTLYGDSNIRAPLYNKKRYATDPLHMAQYSYFLNEYRKFLVGEANIEHIIDIDAFSRALIAAAIWNNSHVLSWSNIKYNFNPYTMKIEPITGDQDRIYPILSADGKIANNMGVAASLPLFSGLLRSPLFYERFEMNLSAVVLEKSSIEAEHRKICAAFPIDCPRFDIEAFNNNLKIIQSQGADYFNEIRDKSVLPKKPDMKMIDKYQPVAGRDDLFYPAHIHGEYYSSGKLVIWNLLSHVLTLDEVKLNCKKKSGCEDKILLRGPLSLRPGSDGVFPASTVFDVEAGLNLNSDARLEISTHVGKSEDVYKIALTIQDLAINPLGTMPSTSELLLAHPYVKHSGGDLNILPGIWDVTTPIKIPAGMHLMVGPGTTLRFFPDSYILSSSPITARGTTDSPVRFIAQNEKEWLGIYVAEAAGESQFNNVEIANTIRLKDGILNLTGGVTFYKSDIKLENVSFSGTNAEDALNIVHSQFLINNVDFKNAVSDAFDSDFSNGKILSSRFTNIGGDGLDTSGSNVSGSNLYFSAIGDKAVSAGEKSNLNLGTVTVDGAGSGVVSKDGSRVNISQLYATNTDLFAGMVYIKKKIYGPAEMTIEKTALKKGKFFNQKKSTLTINGKKINGKNLDVDDLYSTGPMKKN